MTSIIWIGSAVLFYHDLFMTCPGLHQKSMAVWDRPRRPRERLGVARGTFGAPRAPLWAVFGTVWASEEPPKPEPKPEPSLPALGCRVHGTHVANWRVFTGEYEGRTSQFLLGR